MEPLNMCIGTQMRTGQGSGTQAEVSVRAKIKDADNFATRARDAG